MRTIHVYKADCFGASRVMLQATWDEAPFFLHSSSTPDSRGLTSRRISSARLSMRTLLKIFFYDEKNKATRYVFHAQSALPYLVAIRILSRFRRKERQQVLVYDMHDLHEPRQYKSIWEWIRYGLLRYRLLRTLEAYVLSDSSIAKMTVSSGLAQVVAVRYACTPPTVVHSIPMPKSSNFSCRTKNRKSALLYFGQLKHAPIELVNAIDAAGLELHLFGRDINMRSFTLAYGDIPPPSIKFCGPYSPDDLAFLSAYQILVLFKPSITTLNYKNALPNKMFQALDAGVSLLTSPNFTQISDWAEDLPGAVKELKQIQLLRQTVDELLAEREALSPMVLRQHLDECYEASRKNYLKTSLRDSFSLPRRLNTVATSPSREERERPGA